MEKREVTNSPKKKHQSKHYHTTDGPEESPEEFENDPKKGRAL